MDHPLLLCYHASC
ncbi:hypothetical protein LSH36_377g03054 [Paralvinella palmiformis]|uniref:Uncharacterized protein n=1 Tax=Paralvinella palmiformis TaxID=53620 RepID=A0AAD9JEC6_9ANNE|nr:hypothetical protein LSH36_377g03054 [Paralvinella palmiformis]